MENYEQKYKEALKWMQGLYSGLHGATKEEAEHYFPELKESEDERIRKELIQHLKELSKVKDLSHTPIKFKQYYDVLIAWLEKQEPIEQDTELRDTWEYIKEWKGKFGRLPKDEDELAACIDYVMKRQKPADEVEPKFKKE